jgi:hypothetical protein
MKQIKEILKDLEYEQKESKNFAGGMEKYLKDLQDSSDFYNEAFSDGILKGHYMAICRLLVLKIDNSIKKDKVFNIDKAVNILHKHEKEIIHTLKYDYLQYMGYYTHDKEEDKETDKLTSLENFLNYFIEKRHEILEEEL